VKETINFNNPAMYHIRLQENLETPWSEWFEELELTQEADGGTLLTGMVADQSALHGIIRKVRDLGLTLVSLQRMESQPEKPEQGVSS